MMSNNSDMTGGGVQHTLAPMRKLSAVLLLLAGLAACAVDPHKVAELRPVAYQKAVFMGYLNTIIAWADELFRRDTRESVNEAAQLYVLASDLLGERPQEVPERGEPEPTTWAELEADLAADPADRQIFTNDLVEVENLLGAPSGTSTGTSAASAAAALPERCAPAAARATPNLRRAVAPSPSRPNARRAHAMGRGV